MFDFFEFTNEMLCLADERGYFIRVNPAWTETLGWSAEELTSHPFLYFVHPDDHEATIREASLLQSGAHETVRFQNRYRCRDGSYRWISWRARLEPTTRQLVAAARDVTEERLKAEALRASESRFRLLAENAPIGIVQANTQGQVFYVNDRWCELAGVSREAGLGRTWEKLIHPDDLPRLVAHWQSFFDSGLDMPAVEFRFVHPDGQIRWISSSSSLMRDSAGQVISQIGTLVDITERKAAEDALRESEERFQAFMNHSPALAWAKDEAGRYIYFNRAFEEKFQFRMEDWWGKTDFDLFPGEFAETYRQHDQQVMETGKPVHTIEGSVTATSGEAVWMVDKFPFRDRRGNRFVAGVAVDITELQRNRLALLEKQELLRNLIDVQEQEKQFLCQEFHDGLIQYAFGSMLLLESCRANLANPAVPTHLDTAISNLRRGIEDGRRVIRGVRPAVLDDSDLQAAVDDLVGQYENSGIQVICRCDPQIGRFSEAIQTTVYRVAQEALNNAKKYSGTDVVRIELAKVNGELRLEIRDFGCGFDVESARKKGFGLRGMTERVRLLGGEFTIESERDSGSVIKVRLPIGGEPARPEGPPL